MIPMVVAEIMLEQLVGKEESKKILAEVRREVIWQSIAILIFTTVIVSLIVFGVLL